MKLFSFFIVKVSKVVYYFSCIHNHADIILHFADPMLESFYILDPQWISDSLQQVMEKAKEESVNGKIISDFKGRGKNKF